MDVVLNFLNILLQGFQTSDQDQLERLVTDDMGGIMRRDGYHNSLINKFTINGTNSVYKFCCIHTEVNPH